MFNAYCRAFYPNGGNITDPDKQIEDSQKLKDFDTFLFLFANQYHPCFSFLKKQ